MAAIHPPGLDRLLDRGVVVAGVVTAAAVVIVGSLLLAAVSLVALCPWERPRRFVAIRRRVGAHVHPERSWRMHDGPRSRPFRAVRP